MKKYLITGLLALTLLGGFIENTNAQTVPTLSPFYYTTTSSITTRTTSTVVNIPQLGTATPLCVHVINTSGTLATSNSDCGTGGGGGSSTVLHSGAGWNVTSLINGNQTGTLDTTYAASWMALETFLKGVTINGTTTLASTTNAITWANSSGQIMAVTIGQGLSFNTSTGQLSFLNPGFASSSITITGGGILSGGGDLTTNRIISLSTSTLYGLFSGSSPIVFNTSTGQISWTNSNNYITLGSISANSPLSYNNGTGAFSLTTNASTGIALSTTGNVLSIQNTGITTSTGNWAGTWQGVNSTTFYIASNPAGYITTSTFNATGTPFYFPYWNASGTNLSATSSLFISSSTGNVGIGTTSPGYGLDVETGSIKVNNNITGAGQSGTIYLGDGSFSKTYGSGWSFAGALSVSGLISTNNSYTFGSTASNPLQGIAIYEPSANNLSITTSNIDRLRVDSSGNVDIGTTTASALLTLQGTSTSAALLNISSSTGNSLLYVANNGNVGIGTTNPGFALDVQGTSPSVNVGSGGTYRINTYNVLNQPTGSDTELRGANISFNTNNSTLEASSTMFLTSTGNVGIGTTSPSSTLTVNGSFATGNRNISTSTTLTSTSSLVFWIATSTAGTVTLPTIASVANGTCISVTDAGGNAGTNAITVSAQGSDKINGLTTTTLATNNMSLSFCSNGSNFYIQ